MADRDRDQRTLRNEHDLAERAGFLHRRVRLRRVRQRHLLADNRMQCAVLQAGHEAHVNQTYS